MLYPYVHTGVSVLTACVKRISTCVSLRGIQPQSLSWYTIITEVMRVTRVALGCNFHSILSLQGVRRRDVDLSSLLWSWIYVIYKCARLPFYYTLRTFQKRLVHQSVAHVCWGRCELITWFGQSKNPRFHFLQHFEQRKYDDYSQQGVNAATDTQKHTHCPKAMSTIFTFIRLAATAKTFWQNFKLKK